MDFNDVKIASEIPTYSPHIALEPNTTYSLWFDPNANGWDNNVDHFGKIKVERIDFNQYPPLIELRCSYQKIAGLKWLVTE